MVKQDDKLLLLRYCMMLSRFLFHTVAYVHLFKIMVRGKKCIFGTVQRVVYLKYNQGLFSHKKSLFSHTKICMLRLK